MLCSTETWLNDHYDGNCFLVNGYNQCLQSRTSKVGGVKLQVKNYCTLVKDLPNDHFSRTIKNGYLFRVLVVCNKPRANELEFVETLDNNLEVLAASSTPFVICGDFNINAFHENFLTKDYYTCIRAVGFELFDLEPTRVRNISCMSGTN